MKIAILPGDGIGTEIIAEAVKVLKALDLKFELEEAPVGGAAYDAHGHPLPEGTLKLASQADAILFGAVGDWKYDKLDRPLRPEQAILGLRKHSAEGVAVDGGDDQHLAAVCDHVLDLGNLCLYIVLCVLKVYLISCCLQVHTQQF